MLMMFNYAWKCAHSCIHAKIPSGATTHEFIARCNTMWKCDQTQKHGKSTNAVAMLLGDMSCFTSVNPTSLTEFTAALLACWQKCEWLISQIKQIRVCVCGFQEVIEEVLFFLTYVQRMTYSPSWHTFLFLPLHSLNHIQPIEYTSTDIYTDQSRLESYATEGSLNSKEGFFL